MLTVWPVGQSIRTVQSIVWSKQSNNYVVWPVELSGYPELGRPLTICLSTYEGAAIGESPIKFWRLHTQ